MNLKTGVMKLNILLFHYRNKLYFNLLLQFKMTVFMGSLSNNVALVSISKTV